MRGTSCRTIGSQKPPSVLSANELGVCRTTTNMYSAFHATAFWGGGGGWVSEAEALGFVCQDSLQYKRNPFPVVCCLGGIVDTRPVQTPHHGSCKTTLQL